LRQLAGHRWRCDVVAVAPDGKAILSAGSDGCIRLQDQDGNQLRRLLLGGPSEEQDQPAHHVLALGVTPDSKTAVTWSWGTNGGNKFYCLWDLATGKPLSRHFDPSGVVSAPQFSPDAQLAVEHVYEERGKGVAPAAGRGGGGSQGGPTLVGVLLRDVATGRETFQLRHPDGFAGLQAFAPDGRTLLTLTCRQEQTGNGRRYDCAVHFWELASRKERLTVSVGPSSHWIQHVAYAPDGRTLAAAYSDNTIQFWDLITGKERPRRAVVDNPVQCLAFAPDSRLLASGHRDGTILVWDSAAAGGRQGKPDPPPLEQWWADLAGEDARRAYAAVCGFATEPAPAMRLFRDRLRPVTEGPADKLQPLIADLDSPQFQRREAAMKQLIALDEQAGPALRRALRADPSLEQRRRIDQVLDTFQRVRPPETLRHLRAVEVLERIGNREAQDVLEKLARGVPEARLTREAQDSLKRLALRPATVP
jgi:hypothetical protein